MKVGRLAEHNRLDQGANQTLRRLLFDTVVERACHAPQVTVKVRDCLLTKQLNIGLFERSTRHLRITNEGRVIVERVWSALAVLDEATEIARTGSDDLSGSIRITAPLPFGSRYVAAATAAFRKRHPKVGFELQLTDRVVDIYAGEVDVAIRAAHLNDSQLIVRRLSDNRRVLVAAPEYYKQNAWPHEPTDLLSHTCLIFSYSGLPKNELAFAFRRDYQRDFRSK
ncbi:hypothetical protein JZX86_16650 [Agrobacterium rosae]|uniref:LysR family transcriptional regulator n=1 Tax=Agrobacterium rosae TaxID=1972867 RepID=UPI0019D3FF31|nr:LysR family transcriptional regulator [Agrobacterium rosae]MBN7806985.1 hypothetical protein [Agrobacterium rosae]